VSSGLGRASYLRSVALGGLVLLGWLWDFILGGGGTHALAWLAAFLVVAGVSALAVHAARVSSPTALPTVPAAVPAVTAEPAVSAEQAVPAVSAASAVRAVPARADGTAGGRPVEIRVAEDWDLAGLPDLERSADTLFQVAGYGRTPGPATVEELRAAMLVLVAGHPVCGYLRLETVDGNAHIEGLSVALRSMKRGIGSALVEAACDWAWAAGYSAVTLTTFASVPWNGPFYAKRGFVELRGPLPAELAAIRACEQTSGLDLLSDRVAMRRELAG
jgi:GNAT superfamily N-acetyltransferase